MQDRCGVPGHDEYCFRLIVKHFKLGHSRSDYYEQNLDYSDGEFDDESLSHCPAESEFLQFARAVSAERLGWVIGFWKVKSDASLTF